jgi:hypothetical protein
MRRIRVTTILLAMANVALALLVVLLWNRGQARVTEPAQLGVQPLSLPDLAALNSIPMPGVDGTTIREQSVFYPTRAFYRPPAAPVEVSPPEYEMAGTLRLANGIRIAFVKRKADQSSRTLHLGDDLEGWRVQVIDPDRIVVARNEQSAELRAHFGVGGSGLIRGASAPRTFQSGIRVLGAVGSGSMQLGDATSHQLRVFHPPPPPPPKQ